MGKQDQVTADMVVRCGIVIGRGDFSDYMTSTHGRDEPRIEFVEIARATKGDCISYTTAVQEHGKWFRRLFEKRPNLGSALHVAMVCHRYDAIYVTGEDVGLPLALLLRMRGWRGRLICLAHRVTRRRAFLFRLIGARGFHRVITVSRAQADIMVSMTRFPAARVRALYNWVDDQFFDPNLVHRLEEADYVACGAENRDYAVVSRAFSESPRSVIRVFGHGFFGTGIAGADKTRQDRPNIVTMPRVSYKELRDYYGSAKAVIVPLNAVDYAAGVTGAIEAMACGCAVIASETPGIAEYMTQIDPRLRIAPGDAPALVQAIRIIDESDALTRAAWGRANRQWITEHCGLDQYVAKIRQEMLEPEKTV